MKSNNLFLRKGSYGKFARISYKWLMSRKWVTYADIMAEYMKLDSAKDLPYPVSCCDNYGELRKAFPDVCHAIVLKVGNDCIDEKGNNRNKSFKYAGAEDDPLKDFKSAKAIGDLREYWNFCQDSAGFFPISWLEYFFDESLDLLEIKKTRLKGEQVLCSSIDRNQKNIEYLPFIYEAIKKKQVLSIVYKPFDKDMMTLTFHPHYLKEYNGRWHLFGHAEGEQPEMGFDVALDRIELFTEKDGIDYVSAPKGYYKSLFADIVGVSRKVGEEKKEIHIRARSNYIYNLMTTKPIHPNQDTVLDFGEHEDGTYGEFVLPVKLNKELIGSILQMGPELEVVSPPEVRDIFKSKINEMYSLYSEKAVNLPDNEQ